MSPRQDHRLGQHLGIVPGRVRRQPRPAAGIANLRRKSIALTAFLQHSLERLASDELELLTPRDAADRGAQLSFRLRRRPDRAGRIVERLKAQGIVIDWRAPDTLRLAPAPLYNSFADAEAAATALAAALRDSAS